VLLRVVFAPMCLATLATVANAQPALETGPGVEAQVSAGSHGTEHGAVRATETTDGGFGVAVDGSMLDSDRYVTSARDIGAHAQDSSGPRDVDAYARAGDEHRALGVAVGSTDTSLARYGARWRRSGETAIFSAQLAGEVDRIEDTWSGEATTTKLTRNGGVASVRLPAVDAFGLRHDLAIGTGILLASGESEGSVSRMSVGSARMRGNERYLDAYLEDTIRLIQSFDIRAGAVIEQWSNLGGNDVAFGVHNPMETEALDVSTLLVSPTIGFVERLDDNIALHGRVYRAMRTPTVNELYRDGRAGSSVIASNPNLLPEDVWTREAGPELTHDTISVRAAAFYSTVDRAIGVVDGQRQNVGTASIAGTYVDASWQVSPRWLTTLDYTLARPSAVLEAARYPHQLGSAALQYVPSVKTSLLAAVHVIDATSTIVDARAMRQLHGGVSAFVAVENLLDQRYLVINDAIDTLGAPRIVQVGLRIDSKRF
jgi:outer membrane receptor protein involved in Fe transport